MIKSINLINLMNINNLLIVYWSYKFNLFFLIFRLDNLFMIIILKQEGLLI